MDEGRTVTSTSLFLKLLEKHPVSSFTVLSLCLLFWWMWWVGRSIGRLDDNNDYSSRRERSCCSREATFSGGVRSPALTMMRSSNNNTTESPYSHSNSNGTCLSVVMQQPKRMTTHTRALRAKSRNTQDNDINSPVFPLFVVFTEQPETRLYFVQFSIPLRHGCTTTT